MDDDWPNCDAEAVVVALSVRYRFSRANAVQLLRDQGILRPRAEAEADDDDDVEEAEGWGSEEDEEEEEDGVQATIFPMPGQDLVSVGATVVGTGEGGFQDGAAASAMFIYVAAMLHLPDGRVLVADYSNNRIRVLSADLQQVSTVAGDGERGHQDGAAAQALFNSPDGLALLPDGRVLVTDYNNDRIRVLSADLQQVSTVAGDGEQGHQDGAAAQAQFNHPRGLALLPDGRVMMADMSNHRIRVLSADLQQVITVAGDGAEGHRDGAAAQAQFYHPTGLTLLPDGRVLVVDEDDNRIRVLSADLQQVSTLTNVAELLLRSFELLPDGRLLLGTRNCIRVLEGFPAALLGAKPSYKRPKRTNQQQQEKKKRALAGGASSTGRLVPKRSRSGASSSSIAAAPSSSDSEGEEQPGGSAAEAEPLV
jgi:sugar lactone lactonase YvrE